MASYIPMECTERFFSTNFFNFFLTDDSEKKTIYKVPKIVVYCDSTIENNPVTKSAWQTYCNALFVHELCHAFRNFLNKDFRTLLKHDHGLTFKDHVAYTDLITELETLTLEDFILRKTNSELFPNDELKAVIINLNLQVPEPIDGDNLLKMIDKSYNRWNTIGVDGLQEQYYGMIDHLKETL